MNSQQNEDLQQNLNDIRVALGQLASTFNIFSENVTEITDGLTQVNPSKRKAVNAPEFNNMIMEKKVKKERRKRSCKRCKRYGGQYYLTCKGCGGRFGERGCQYFNDDDSPKGETIIH